MEIFTLVMSIIGRLWDAYDKHEKNKDATADAVRLGLEKVDAVLAEVNDDLDAAIAEKNEEVDAEIDRREAAEKKVIVTPFPPESSPK